MRTRALLLILLFAAVGFATAFRGTVTGYRRPSEAWLEDQVPARIGAFTYIPSPENPKQSYRMDDRTYAILDPIGIVARTYNDGKQTFDVVVIAGDHQSALHDPRICFVAQGWEILSEKQETISTPNLGNVPVVALQVRRPDDPTPRTALFTYRGPSGRFFTSQGPLWQDFMTSELRAGRPQRGYFYRVIAADPAAPDPAPFAARFFSEVARP